MKPYGVKLAKKIKERDNIEPNEALIGTIISVNPIRVSLFGGAAIFTENDEDAPLYVCENLKSIAGTIVLDDGSSQRFTMTRELNKDDSILCIPISKGQAYVAVYKV